MPRSRPTPPRSLTLGLALTFGLGLGLAACAGAEAESESESGSATESDTDGSSSAATNTTTTTGASASATTTATTDTTTTTTTDPTTTTTTGSTSGEGPSCRSLPLCDDFEGAAPGGPPDPALWTIAAPNCMGSGALTIDDQVAHSGGRSLRVDGGGGYCDHIFIANEAVIQGLGGVTYGRFFVRLGAPLGQGHVTFMTMHDVADAGGKDLRMGGQSEILMWNRESDDATLPVLSPTGIGLSITPAAESWVCVEFMVSAAGLLETSVDGQAIAGLVVDADATADVDQQWHQKAEWAPELVDFKLGWESYAGQTMTLWFDDVALSSAPIGCG